LISQRQNRCARHFAEIFPINLYLASRCWFRSAYDESGKCAMNVAAGVNAFHDFLSYIAALIEVKRACLLRLLRQVSIADIQPVARQAGGNSKKFIGFKTGGTAACFHECIPEQAD